MPASSSRPSWEIVASLWLHFSAAIVLVLFERCTPSPSEPLFKPQEVMRVQLAAAPKPKASRTQRAERAPDPPAAPATAAPPPTASTPPPQPPPPPPPPASEMALRDREKAKTEPSKAKTEPSKAKTEQAKAKAEPSKAKAEPPASDNTSARQALLAQQREQASPDAPLGTTNRQEAGPDGVEGATASPIGIGEADPVLAAYILACRDALLPNWTPLPSMVAEHPEYAVVVQVPVAADGTLGTPKIVKSSGDPSFDRTATMALAKTRRLPPPPAAWQASAAKGVQIRLAAKDK